MCRKVVPALKYIHCFWVVILLIAFPLLTTAQSREIVSQGIEWSSLTVGLKVHKKVTINSEGQFRFARALEPMQFQWRTSVDVQLTKALSISPFGYVYTWNPLYGKQPNTFINNEHRTWQQIMYKHSIGRIDVSHRGRLEQRHIQVHVNNNGEIVDKGYENYSNRARYRLMMDIPLNRPAMETGAIFTQLYDEVFVSWGGTVTYNKPDQNRIFAGVGYMASSHFQFTLGGLYQMLVKSNGEKQENNIGALLSATYNFDLTE